MTALLLLLLWLPARCVSAEPYVVVGRLNSGTVFYRGNELARPYEVVLTYRVEGDTLWQGLYVNHLPVLLMPKETPGAPASSEEADSNSAYARHERLTADVARCIREFPRGGPALQMALDDVARSHNQRGRFVDSIVVHPDLSVSVLFTGHPFLEYVKIVNGAFPPNRHPNDVLLADGQTLVRELHMNRVVVIGPNGIGMHGPPSLAEHVRHLQRNTSAKSRIVINPDVLHDLRHPLPLGSVKRGDYR